MNKLNFLNFQKKLLKFKEYITYKHGLIKVNTNTH